MTAPPAVAFRCPTGQRSAMSDEDDTSDERAERNREKDEHGIDIEEDTNLDTAGDDEDEEEAEAPEEPMPDRDPGREDADGEDREEEAAEQENPDAHRDESPYQ